MTPFDEYLLRVDDYFKKYGVEFFFIGSSLLHLIRSGYILQTSTFDRELNIGVRAEDVTNKFNKQLKKDNEYFRNDTNDEYENYFTFFGPQLKERCWDADYFTLMPKFWKKKGIRYEHGGSNLNLVWPEYQLKKFSKIKYLGRTFNTPANPEKWLSHYFGEDWRTPKATWNWAVNANNLVCTNDLDNYKLPKLC